ncbi:hypothetical protein PBT90_12120 [Algoriphagus halophytocola]|uniref:Uncharacterized protein n=1 Tax=Algoriphagus halophytocola TaxID=2991499 RepID=A0ABY6MLW4_9BACT|nr:MULTISPECIES: hypothetical protein [unclassified Algoriphagus]UZD24130.1 hypothetical protein OM944_06430 [Algoriphagus sp. TR-M5]WBL41501.1 hypothetical protein PBT90_12120 [Algoriphagus sp. TR-M9]
MKNLLSLLIFAVVFSTAYAQETPVPSKEIQIKTAVLAAPHEKQKDASVLGYDSNGELVELKKGSNEMICIASNPTGKGFSVSCYQSDLEPFMQRGRELKQEGKSFQEIFDIREEEAKSGKLQMPKDGATLFVLSAENFDANTGKIEDTYLRYVVYLPWATPETTGLPLKPDAPGMPWIMDPGTHRAHIMITPARD